MTSTGKATGKKLRLIKAREPKLVENTKKALFIRGNKTSEVVSSLLKDLYELKKPDGIMYQRRNQIIPFENETSLEFFSSKSDASLFAFASHTKKRPNSLILGRMFEHRLLDMIELGIMNYIPIRSFTAASRPGIGNKPCFIFKGEEFDRIDTFRKFRNLVVDFFRGAVIESINLAGLEHVIVCTAIEDRIFFRHYGVSLRKSGTKIPRVELTETGPSFECTIRRHKFASDDLMRQATRVPKQTQPTKKKNFETTPMGETLRTIHMGRQDLSGLNIKRVKALKRKYQHISAEDSTEGGATSTSTSTEDPSTSQPRKRRARSSDSSAAAD